MPNRATLIDPHQKATEPAIYRPWPKQREFMELIMGERVNEALFGGQAGGGKSAVIRMMAMAFASIWPGSRIAIFRRVYKELEQSHIREFFRELPENDYHFSRTHMRFEIINGPNKERSHIDMNHAATTDDVYNYQSVEFSALFIDEAEQFTEEEITELTSRVRAPANLRNAWEKAGYPWWPCTVLTANPGDRGHEYLKTTFVQPGRHHGPGQPWVDLVEVNGMVFEKKRMFMPSTIDDNPSIDKTTYMAQLAHLPLKRRKQLLEGDWDYFEGQAFAMLDPDIHLIDPTWVFGDPPRRPRNWRVEIGFDHGQVNPACGLWSCEDSEGYFITYQEYYQANAGVGVHVDAMLDLMQRDGSLGKIAFCDPQMQRLNRGIGARRWSLRDEYAWNGEPPERPGSMEPTGIRMIMGMQDRQVRLYTIQRLLEPDPDRIFPSWHPKAGQYGSPRLFISRACPNLWRELTNARYEAYGKDGTASEDIEKVNDHAIDALGFHVPFLERRRIGQRGLQPVATLAPTNQVSSPRHLRRRSRPAIRRLN